MYILLIVYPHLCSWNSAKKLLKLFAWLAFLEGPCQQLAYSFLVALPTISGNFVERPSGILIGEHLSYGNLESCVGHVLTHRQRIKPADRRSKRI